MNWYERLLDLDGAAYRCEHFLILHFLCICAKKKFIFVANDNERRNYDASIHRRSFSQFSPVITEQGNHIILTFFRIRYTFFYPNWVFFGWMFHFSKKLWFSHRWTTIPFSFFCVIFRCLSYVLRPKNAIKVECATQLRFSWSKMQTNQRSGGLGSNFEILEKKSTIEKSPNNIWILILFKLPKTTRNQKQKSVKIYIFRSSKHFDSHSC